MLDEGEGESAGMINCDTSAKRMVPVFGSRRVCCMGRKLYAIVLNLIT